MQKRMVPVALGIMVMVITLAGLLGVLQLLAVTRDPELSPSSQSSYTGSPAVSDREIIDGACPVCHGNPQLGSGNCPVCGGTGKIDTGVSLNPSLAPEGGLPPSIPLFQVSGAPGTSFLRTTATSFYDGKLWTQKENSPHHAYQGEKLILPVAGSNRPVTSDINIVRLGPFLPGTLPLPTALNTVSLSSSLPLTYYPEQQLFISELGMPESYGFQANRYSFTEAALASAEVDPLPEYLQLPANISPRTRQLAQEITRDQSRPYQKAKAIENYLKNNYVYNLDYQRAPEGCEPNDWFLFEEKRGVCSNFNSAFVILARSAGLPSRLVGGYKIQPAPEEQIVNSDQAHAWAEVKFKNAGWQTFDATGSGPGPIPTVTEITISGPQAQKGSNFQIQGSVATDSGQPVDGIPLEIFLNTSKETAGGRLIGKGMCYAGHFEIETMIPEDLPVGNYQILAHCLGGFLYRESWSDPPLKVVAGTSIEADIPLQVNVDELMVVKGSLTEKSGLPVAGQTLAIYIQNEPVRWETTGKEGQFTWEHSFNSAGKYTLRVDFPGTEYFLQSGREWEIQALTPTVVLLRLPDQILAGEPAILEGSLIEMLTGNPLPGRTIEFLINGLPLKEHPATGQHGGFRVEQTFKFEGEHELEARFKSIPFYAEASARANIDVLPGTGGGFPWVYPVIGALLAFTAGGGVFYYRRRKGHPYAAGAQNIPTPDLTPASGPEKAATGISLKILLPQIEDPFPDVWGLRDELEVIYRLSGPDGKALAGSLLKITGDKEILHIFTDEMGEIRLKLTFTHKGPHKLTARFQGEPGGTEVTAARIVRIVDYREEIADLYQALLVHFRTLGIGLSPEATPREVEKKLSRSGKALPEAALNTAINYFEEAEYSLHEIERGKYQIMYLAWKKMGKHDR